MKLIMGVSSDGYVASGPRDTMQWLGHDDKVAFKLLTSVGGICGTSARSRALMPMFLKGRTVMTISRDHGQGIPMGHVTLKGFASLNGWLLGGQHLALAAFREGLIDEAFICVSDHKCPGTNGIPDLVTTACLSTFGEPSLEVRIGTTLVRKFER